MAEIGITNETCMELIKKLEYQIKSLCELIDTSDYKLESYCDYLRNEVDLCSESQIMLLNQYREQLIQEVDSYQERCILFKNSNELIDIHNNLNKIQIERLNKLKFEVNINENEIMFRCLYHELKSIESDIYHKNSLVHEIIYNNKKLKFLESNFELKSCHIGQFTYETCSINSLNFNLTNVLNGDYMMKVPIKIQYNTKNERINEICIHEAFDNYIIIAYVIVFKTLFGYVTGYKLFMSLYYINHTKPEYEGSYEYDKISKLYLTSTTNYIVIVNEMLNDNIKFLYNLQTYNKQLNLKQRKKIDFFIKAIYAQNTKIYLLTNKMLFIHIYNEDLQEIFTLGQNLNLQTPFYLTPNSQLALIDWFLITYENCYIRITKNGNLIKKISLTTRLFYDGNQIDASNFHYFQAISVFKFLFVDYSQKFFVIYDIHGLPIDYVYLNNNLIQKISSVYVTKKNNILVLDTDSHTLYIY